MILRLVLAAVLALLLPCARRRADAEAGRHARGGDEPGPARARPASVDVDHHLPGPQPRLPGPGGFRSRPQDQARPRRVVDHQRRRQGVDVRAPQGREVPQRAAAHRQRREVLARSHPRPEDCGARSRVRSSIIESVQVVDPQTVRVHLTRASGAFLSRIAGTYQAILPPEAVQGPAFKAIGTGPFQLTEWKTNERVELKRFDGYWEAGLPYLDALTLKPVPDGDRAAHRAQDRRRGLRPAHPAGVPGRAAGGAVQGLRRQQREGRRRVQRDHPQSARSRRSTTCACAARSPSPR